MLFLGEAFVGAVVYVLAGIATLRAGSRLVYILQNGNIGVMDGPLILGPSDTPCNVTIVNTTQNEKKTPTLWEYTYAFKQAVYLSLRDQKKEKLTLTQTDGNHNKVTLLDNDFTEEAYRSRLDSITKRDLVKRGFRLRLLNELMKGGIANERTKYDSSLQRKWNLWYHFWIDPLILCLLKMTTSPITFHEIYGERPHWVSKIDNRKWDYDDVSTFLVPLPYSPLDDTIQNSKTIARVKAYTPNVFSDLRRLFGINPRSFTQSIFSSGPFVSFQSNSKGASRSGGFFFFTRDGMFMIKTIKATEMQSLQRMLPSYHKYMMRNSKKSLLTRFCGVYGVQLLKVDERKQQRKTKEMENEQYFLIMNSVFPVEASKFIRERFDIKGSTVGRSCSKEEIEQKKSLAVYKDLDLVNEKLYYGAEGDSRHPWKTGMEFGERLKSSLLNQLRHDVGLLMKCDVMDYSLLMGVVMLDDDQKPTMYKMTLGKTSCSSDPLSVISSPLLYICARIISAGEKLLSSVLTVPFPYYGADLCGVDCGKLSRIEGRRHGRRAVFYLGLIDFLQPWTTRKLFERELKGLVGYNKHLISCVNPQLYASRFLEFVDSIIC